MADPFDQLNITTQPDEVAPQESIVRCIADGITDRDTRSDLFYEWSVEHTTKDGTKTTDALAVDSDEPWLAYWSVEPKAEVGPYDIVLDLWDLDVWRKGQGRVTVTLEPIREVKKPIMVGPRGFRGDPLPLNVSLQRIQIPDTMDVPFWEYIRASSEALSFNNYARFIDYVICGTPANKSDLPDDVPADAWDAHRQRLRPSTLPPSGRYDYFPETRLPFPDVESYRILKAATEAFMMMNCGVFGLEEGLFEGVVPSLLDQEEGLGLRPGQLNELWREFLVSANGKDITTLPYLALVRQKLKDVSLTTVKEETRILGEICYAILREKLTNPCLLELIWSYWHEEGMLVQTMNALSMRFQNRRGPADVDPLANLAIDPLRPLNNLLWGYIQDEQHRLTVARRVYEYDHEYGLTLLGRAVPAVRSAETRSKFLGAFHNLLHRASIFYKEDDDTTMIADPFPVLNALREVHLLLAEGAHNQYGDLPWTARHEMLMQQWILARPEFREFLPSRIMVVYPEPWMERVDAVKRVMGWTETSVRYFSDLATFGEQILLSIRFGNWSNIIDRDDAADWARSWRRAVQWYIHAYQTVTGVDLSADMADVRQAEQAEQRAMQPALHLQRRLVQQQRSTRVAVQRAPGQPALPRQGRRVQQ